MKSPREAHVEGTEFRIRQVGRQRTRENKAMWLSLQELEAMSIN